MREKTVCFTGHRIIPSEKRASLFAHLTDVITSLLEAGYRYFGAGGALGFDRLASSVTVADRVSTDSFDSRSALQRADQRLACRRCRHIY